MRSLKTLTFTLLLLSALPMFGAAYIKFDGVDGDVKAAGHEKWIELTSLQNEDGSTPAAMLSQGRVRVSSGGSYLTQLDRLCQAKKPLGDVLVDVDGTRHVLHNAHFTECPSMRGGVMTTVLEFGTTSTAAWPSKLEIGALKAGAQPSVTPSTALRGNATISGLARTPLSMDIRRATLIGKAVTIYLKAGTMTQALGKPVMEATAKGNTFPQIVIESAGQQWSFTKVMFTSASFSDTQDTVFSFQFDSMTGSAVAFQALGN